MLNKKGQNTAEYAILIALVIAAAVGMQTYVKRGVQARMRDETKSFTSALSSSGDWANITNATATMSSQYEPDKLSKQSTQQIIADTENSTMIPGGSVSREVNKTTTQATTDYQKYGY